jgi:hypothetical protein
MRLRLMVILACIIALLSSHALAVTILVTPSTPPDPLPSG